MIRKIITYIDIAVTFIILIMVLHVANNFDKYCLEAKENINMLRFKYNYEMGNYSNVNVSSICSICAKINTVYTNISR